jgi:hypothetical protein
MSLGAMRLVTKSQPDLNREQGNPEGIEPGAERHRSTPVAGGG